MNPPAGMSSHDIAMQEDKIHAVTSDMLNYEEWYVGNGYNRTHSWMETFTPWVRFRDDLDETLFWLDRNEHGPIWYELQRAVNRYTSREKYRLRLRIKDQDRALLIKLSLDV